MLVNAEGKYSTVINGNVNFSYDVPTSQTPVEATVVLNLAGPESSWTGNTVVSWRGNPTSEDEYLSVTGMKPSLCKGAAWTPGSYGSWRQLPDVVSRKSLEVDVHEPSGQLPSVPVESSGGA